MRTRLCWCLALMTFQSGLTASSPSFAADYSRHNGYDLTKTGLTPRYPSEYACSPLTSLYASWDDVDGSKRDELHSGVDGGRSGDAVTAPAAGRVVAVWKANWGWGEEGALLIRHSREDLNLASGPKAYFSEFDHLLLKDLSWLSEDSHISRGETLATVATPGGDSQYLPEVHWEVWQVDDESKTEWKLNKFGDKYWINQTAHLIDPLYMLGLNAPPRSDGNVAIQVYDRKQDYNNFRGFTYILPCTPVENESGTNRHP